jgi:hypothetical protein
MSLAGVSLDSFDAASVGGALAAVAGVRQDAVSVMVVGFDITTVLSLSGGITGLNTAQRAALASSLAASIGVSPAQVKVDSTAAAAHLLRRLHDTDLQVAVTVSGLGPNVASVRRAATALTSAAALNAAVANLAAPDISGVTATPVELTAHLKVAVIVPASSTLAEVTSSLSSSNALNLALALHDAGVNFSDLHVDAPPTTAAPPLPNPAETLTNNTGMAVAISLSIFCAFLMCGGICYWSRRMRASRAVVTQKWVGKTFVKDEEEEEEKESDHAGQSAQPTRTRPSALSVPSADMAARRDVLSANMDYAPPRKLNSAATYIMTPIAETADALPPPSSWNEVPVPPKRPGSAQAARPRLPSLMVPSADVAARRNTILDVTAEAPGAGPLVSVVSPRTSFAAGGSPRGSSPSGSPPTSPRSTHRLVERFRVAQQSPRIPSLRMLDANSPPMQVTRAPPAGGPARTPALLVPASTSMPRHAMLASQHQADMAQQQPAAAAAAGPVLGSNRYGSYGLHEPQVAVNMPGARLAETP